MSKIILLPIFLFLQINVLAQFSSELYFGELSCGWDSLIGDYYEVEIMMDSRSAYPCAGFQFEITNILIDTLYGGAIAQNGWWVFYDDSLPADSAMVLAFAFGPPYIPSDLSVLTIMRFTNPNDSSIACLTNFIYSDSAGIQVPTSVGPCIELPPFIYSQNAELCNGDSILLAGKYQFDSGIYDDSLIAHNGCDSIIRTSLLIYDTYKIIDTNSICSGDSILLGNMYFSNSGTYYDSMQTVKGCDSIFIHILSVNDIYEILDTASICSGDSILLGNKYYSTAGTYHDSMQTIKGCDSVYIHELMVNNLPLPIISQNSNVLTSDLAVSYQWYQNDTLLISENNQSYSPIVSGSYSVSVTDSNGCSGSSDTLELIVIGIREFPNKLDFAVYPNPFTEQANICFYNLNNGSYSMIVYNLFGKIVLEKKEIREKQMIIHRNELSSGIYFIDLKGDYGRLVKKLIIK